MAYAQAESGFPTPEVYQEKPIYFRTVGNDRALFAMREYRAGGGSEPTVDDEMALRIPNPERQNQRHEQGVAPLPSFALIGRFQIVDVQDGSIQSPFLPPAEDPNDSYWGVTIAKVGELTAEDLGRLEEAGLVALM